MRPSASSTLSKKHMYGLCRDSDPVTRMLVPDLQDLRRDPVARELRDAVRLADVLLRLAVLVHRGDVHVAVRIARLELGHRARDADRFARVEVRREAVMREGRGADQGAGHYSGCDGYTHASLR